MGRIVAIGGGGLIGDRDVLMHRYVLSRAETARPKVCFVATGKGDDPVRITQFHEVFGRYACDPSHLALFDRDVRDLGTFLLGQDIVFVWGGNTASMLAVWRAHGVDEILRKAYEAGVVLAGICAGALVWFEDGVTDSFGGLDPLGPGLGLGLVAKSHCPHYDADPERRPAYHRMVASGDLVPGHAADVDVALTYEDGKLVEVVASRPDAYGWEVTPDERRLPTRQLGQG